MKKLIIIILLAANAAMAQKPDFIRTPNGPNTIVDWNLKAKTLVLPHGATLGLFGSQDTTGNVFMKQAVGDTALYVRVAGLKWMRIGGTGSQGITVKVTAGTNLPLVVAYNLTNRPNVSTLIPLYGDGTNTKLTSSWNRVDVVYSSTDKATAVSLNIYGNNDGSGKFNEDTYIKITP